MSTSRIAAAIGLIVAVGSAASSKVASAAPGDLDPTFGTGGRVVTSFGSFDTGVAGALQSDGKIVVTGVDFNGVTDVRVTRYDSAGALDPSFGTGGTVTTDLGADEMGAAIAVQDDMKIVVGVRTGFFGGGPGQFALVRYLPNGTLDPTFGTGGIVVTPIGDSATTYAVALQSDGKIIAAGGASTSDFADNFALARYDVDGSLDSSFGSGGIVMTDVGYSDTAHAVTIQSDGRIVAVGAASQGFALARYEADGDLDTTFGSGGVVITAGQSDAYGEAIIRDADGRYVVAGHAFDTGLNHRVINVARYTDGGTLDASFGTAGIAQPVLGTFPQGDSAHTLLQLPSGHYLVAGATANQGSGFALLEYLDDGSLDPGFGNGGVVTTVMPPGFGGVTTILRQTDGKLVATGSTCRTDVVCAGGECYPVPSCKIALARYEGHPCGNGTLDPGENCDDGNARDGDCCSSTCQLDGAGTPCEDEDGACYDDVCDGAGACERHVRVPTSCVDGLPGAARLTIKDKATDTSDGLKWKWTSGSTVTVGDLGDPFAHGYRLCIVDDAVASPTVRVAAAAPAGGTCAGKPCWRASSSALGYRDKQLTPDGLSVVQLKPGSAGKAKFLIKGKGAGLALPALPWTTPVVVRLHREDDPNLCWEATCSTATKNHAGVFKASSD